MTGLIRPFTLVLTALAVCLSCNPRGRVESARKAIEEFHARYNQQDFAGMYRLAGPAVKSSASLESFTKYMKNIRLKLGDLKSAEVRNYHLLYILSGPQVRFDYDCRFAQDRAVESFEINFKDGRPVIDGYRIDSAKLNDSK